MHPSKSGLVKKRGCVDGRTCDLRVGGSWIRLETGDSGILGIISPKASMGQA
jgi:hypothetical protein